MDFIISFWQVHWLHPLYKCAHAASVVVTPHWPLGGKYQQHGLWLIESDGSEANESRGPGRGLLHLQELHPPVKQNTSMYQNTKTKRTSQRGHRRPKASHREGRTTAKWLLLIHSADTVFQANLVNQAGSSLLTSYCSRAKRHRWTCIKQQTLIFTNYLVTVELNNWTHLVEAPAETHILPSFCSEFTYRATPAHPSRDKIVTALL